MDDNTKGLIASNLTLAYYSIITERIDKRIPKQSNDQILDEILSKKGVWATYQEFLKLLS